MLNRQVLERAVRYLHGQGIDQFLDLGSGLPTARNTHEIAQELNPRALVAYVDNDPIVLTHARAQLAGDAATTVVTADIRHPDTILSNPAITAFLDFSRPIGLVLNGVVHHLNDDEDPHGVVTKLTSALAPGSYLQLTHFSTAAPAAAALERVLMRSIGSGRMRSAGRDHRLLRRPRAGGPRASCSCPSGGRTGRSPTRSRSAASSSSAGWRASRRPPGAFGLKPPTRVATGSSCEISSPASAISARVSACSLRRPRLLLIGMLPAVLTTVVLLGAMIALIANVGHLAALVTPFANGWPSGGRQFARLAAGVALVGGGGRARGRRVHRGDPDRRRAVLRAHRRADRRRPRRHRAAARPALGEAVRVGCPRRHRAAAALADLHRPAVPGRVPPGRRAERGPGPGGAGDRVVHGA